MKTLLSLSMLAALAASSHAVLWNQSDYTLEGIVDQEFSDFADFSTFAVGDITLSSASNITSVSTLIGFFTNQAGWMSVNSARLNIFSKTGPFPTQDPTTGTVVSATNTLFNATDNIWEFKASGLNINLAAGSYWVGLTPISNFGTNGQAFHATTGTQIGDSSKLRNPGGGFGFGTEWSEFSAIGFANGDATLIVDGAAVPEPASMAVLGLGIAALVRRRRNASK